jgi:long-subunit acyl-CoA synthetase (AMP-forming)
MPVTLLKRALGAGGVKPMSEPTGAAAGGKASPMDDLAAVIFSSGSTGDPKGVMLSHFNVMSNVRQVSQASCSGPATKF